MTTLGYGRIAPLGVLINSIAALESMLGLLTFAIVMKMLFARFSRTLAKIKYSDNALILPYEKING
jgi:inward rectifier potassium channel